MSNTLTPFLYQTRTLQRVARVRLARPTATVLRSGLHTTARRAHSEIPFQLPPDLDAKNPDMQDSITPTERVAFEQIFREIAERGRKPKLPRVEEPPEEKIAPEASRLIAALQLGGPGSESDAESKKGANFNVNSIIEHAAMKQEQTQSQTSLRGLDPLSPLNTTYSATERENALLRFPPTLRRAARMAFGMLDVMPQPAVKVEGGQQEDVGTNTTGKEVDAVDLVASKLSNEQLAKTVQFEAQRREERLRIKALMDASRNDFELWEVIEDEIFPLVERLGMTDAPPNPSFRPKRKGYIKGKRKAPAQEPPEVVAEDAKQAQRPALNMEIYGPIYPQLLLECLELLDKKFARPSPYTTHLLPRIKQLGLVSYVLGVSTSFYNRLMSALWHRHGDAVGVFNLLEEMRHAGLFFDENSKSLLHDIERVYLQAEKKERGRFASELMKMPEYEPLLAHRLSHWVGHIDRSIAEQRAGLGF